MDAIQEIEKFRAAIFEKSELRKKLPLLESFKCVKPRIPSIIHLDKDYEQFSVEIADESSVLDNIRSRHGTSSDIQELKRKCVLIFLNVDTIDNTEIFVIDVVLVLKAAFFTHTELISKFTNGEVQFSAYEMIGDIIHLNLTEEQQKYKQIIAEVIFFKTGHTVINKTGKIEENFRFYHSEFLAGPNKLTTVHIENNVRFFIDLSKVYWCSRLQNERSRLIGMVKRGETICDPFCGVGPHVLPAIKKGAIALCNDLNPDAIDCLKKSLELNKLSCKCIKNMDAGEFLESISNSRVDHFVFNLPEYSLDYIRYTQLFKGNFMIHVFFFHKEGRECTDIIKERTGYTIKDSWLREIRKVSPSKSVYKLEVTRNDLYEINDI